MILLGMTLTGILVTFIVLDLPLLLADASVWAWSLLWTLDGEPAFFPLVGTTRIASAAQELSLVISSTILCLCFATCLVLLSPPRLHFPFFSLNMNWKALQKILIVLTAATGLCASMWLAAGYNESRNELCSLKNSVHAHMLKLGLPASELSLPSSSNGTWQRLERAIDQKLRKIHTMHPTHPSSSHSNTIVGSGYIPSIHFRDIAANNITDANLEEVRDAGVVIVRGVVDELQAAEWREALQL
jgi:hypothetical protein